MSDKPRPGNVLQLLESKRGPNQSVLEMMRDIMAKCEAGEIVSITVVVVTEKAGTRGRWIVTGIGGESEPLLMLGGLQTMITKVQKWWLEE